MGVPSGRYQATPRAGRGVQLSIGGDTLPRQLSQPALVPSQQGREICLSVRPGPLENQRFSIHIIPARKIQRQVLAAIIPPTTRNHIS